MRRTTDQLAKRAAWALAGVAAFSVACGDPKPLPTAPDDPRPDPSATFTRVQGEVFATSCALAGCHAATAPASDLDLSAANAYAHIVGVAAVQRPGLNRVQPGDPERSYLVKKMRGDADISGERMPPGGPYLAAQVQLVTDWVRRGAPRD